MITKSAKKANRQNIKRRAINAKNRKNLREVIKNYKKSVSGKNSDEAKKILSKVYQMLDKAAKTNLIAKNRASRLKSRLTKLLFPKKK